MPSPLQKVCFLALYIGLELLMAYLIALIHVGLSHRTSSLLDLIKAYAESGKVFPFLLYFFFSILLAFGIIRFLWKSAAEDEERGFKLSSAGTYGNAKDITRERLEKITEICPKEAAMDTILGQLDDSETKLITMKQIRNFNRNVLVFGPPGSGKTFNFSINYILQIIRRGESGILADSKGDAWAETAEFARRHGYIVRRLDLRNIKYSDGFHILKELRHDDQRALITAQIIMRNTSIKGTNDPHAAAEEALLRACMLYVERRPFIPESERTLYGAMNLLLQGMVKLDETFAQIAYIQDEELRPAYDAYSASKTGSENLRGNIVANLASRLAILTSPDVKRLTSTDDLNLTLPGQRPCLYYCVMSDQHETMRFLSTLFFSFAIFDLTEYADKQMSRTLPVRVNVMLEEAANIGEIPSLSKYLHTQRSRGVEFAMCFQSLGQIREIYGEEQTTAILNACATHVCFGFNDKDTAEYYDWRSGETTVEVKTEQHQLGYPLPRLGQRFSTGDGRRSYYSSNDLMKLQTNQVFLSWQREDCLVARTFGMNRHIAYLTGDMKTIEPDTQIPLQDTEARAFFRAHEEERVEKYEAWIKAGGDPWQDYIKPKPQFSGPAIGTPLPEIIPYQDLERMALEHSQQFKEAHEQSLRQQLYRTVEPASTIPQLPDIDFTPIDTDSDSDTDANTKTDIPAQPQKTTEAEAVTPSGRRGRGRPSKQVKTVASTVIMEETRPAQSLSSFGVPGDAFSTPPNHPRKQKRSSAMIKAAGAVPQDKKP